MKQEAIQAGIEHILASKPDAMMLLLVMGNCSIAERYGADYINMANVCMVMLTGTGILPQKEAAQN